MPAADALLEASIAAMTEESTAKIAIPTADYANVEAIVARYRQAGVALALEGRTIIRMPHFSFYTCLASTQKWRNREDVGGAGVVGRNKGASCRRLSELAGWKFRARKLLCFARSSPRPSFAPCRFPR